MRATYIFISSKLEKSFSKCLKLFTSRSWIHKMGLQTKTLSIQVNSWYTLEEATLSWHFVDYLNYSEVS